MQKHLHCIVFLLIFAACSDPARVYEQNLDLPGNLWLADKTAEFEFEIKDSERTYNLYYNIRNSLSYPYHNLYVRHVLEDSIGNELASALQNMDLFDPVTGKPLGEGLGDIFDHKILAISNKKFPEDGWYRFKIQQFMRQDSLPLILSIGLRVETIDEVLEE
jgi:gliding motility-associated lipoprotein GldH